MLLAAAVFVGTYVLLSLPRVQVRGVRVTRPLLALAGGAAMLAVGAVAPSAAARAIDLPTLALLLGMMMLVAALEVAGFFDLLASWIVARARSQRALLASTMVAVAVLSALFLNDAVVLLFTPVLLSATARMGVSATPYLAGEAVAANVGSVATPIGNPQNAYVALAGDLDFLTFTARLAPVAAVCLAVAVLLALLVFRRELAAPLRPAVSPPRAAHPILLPATLAVVAGVLALFAASSATGWPLWAIAAGGGLAAFLLADGILLARGERPASALFRPEIPRRVNWGVLVFFVGLFVLLAGVRESGLLAAFLAALAFAPLETPVGLGLAVALLSNLVSNVPAVLLLAPLAHGPDAWLALAAASTLAGNATLLGAAANVIVAEQARAHGSEFDVWRFVAYGLPVTLVTLAIALAWLA